jgi:hypothetical protein
MNEHIRRAFVMANKAAEHYDFPAPARSIFRAIRYELWLANGRVTPGTDEPEPETEQARRLPPV